MQPFVQAGIMSKFDSKIFKTMYIVCARGYCACKELKSTSLLAMSRSASGPGCANGAKSFLQQLKMLQSFTRRCVSKWQFLGFKLHQERAPRMWVAMGQNSTIREKRHGDNAALKSETK
jgi:hypothetical protein